MDAHQKPMRGAKSGFPSTNYTSLCPAFLFGMVTLPSSLRFRCLNNWQVSNNNFRRLFAYAVGPLSDWALNLRRSATFPQTAHLLISPP